MNDSVKPSSPDPRSHVGHELTDINPRPIGLFALGLFVMMALVMWLLSSTYWRFEARARRADLVQSPLAGDQAPPAPRLEPQPALELKRLRDAEDRRLSSYGWVDQERKVVHIPISRAMELLSKRGLPEPDGPSESATQEERAP